MQPAAGALITWTNGKPHFTAAGHEHYAAACSEVDIAFLPQTLQTAAALRGFLRELLRASVALRKLRPALETAAALPLSPMQSLARRALSEVAHTAGQSAAPAMPDLVQVAQRPGRGSTGQRSADERHAA